MSDIYKLDEKNVLIERIEAERARYIEYKMDRQRWF